MGGGIIATGYLQVCVYTACYAQEIAQASIRIYQFQKDTVVFEDFFLTAQDGKTMEFALHTPSTYHVEIKKRGYASIKIKEISLEDDSHTVLSVNLIPICCMHTDISSWNYPTLSYYAYDTGHDPIFSFDSSVYETMHISSLQTLQTFLSDSPFFLPTAVLRQGDTGSEVRYLTHLLSAIALFTPFLPSIPIDTTFTPTLEHAVRSFQTQFHCKGDGIVGKQTWHRLLAIASSLMFLIPSHSTTQTIKQGDCLSQLKLNDTGDDVSTLQRNLQIIATAYSSIFAVDVDGVYGQQTKQAVISFQQLLGLTVDGIMTEFPSSILQEMVTELQNQKLQDA